MLRFLYHFYCKKSLLIFSSIYSLTRQVCSSDENTGKAELPEVYCHCIHIYFNILQGLSQIQTIWFWWKFLHNEAEHLQSRYAPAFVPLLAQKRALRHRARTVRARWAERAAHDGPPRIKEGLRFAKRSNIVAAREEMKCAGFSYDRMGILTSYKQWYKIYL